MSSNSRGSPAPTWRLVSLLSGPSGHRLQKRQTSHEKIYSPPSLCRSPEAEQNWKMLSTFRGMILLVIHVAQSQENTNTLQKLDQIVASPRGDIQITCNLPPGSQEQEVVWYKEGRDRSLRRIYWSHRFSNLEGKYSGQVPHLTISKVQRNDSGVYYCSSSTSWNFRLFSGARLIVTDTPRPSRSILVPFPLEGTQPNHPVPRLCLTTDANPHWGNFSWDINEELSPDQKGVGVMDEDGVFSIWQLEMIPLDKWTEEEVYSRSLQENRSTRAVVSTDKGTCIYSLYLGIPSILILWVLSFILIFRKLRARGNSEQVENQMPMREISQTNYAEVCYKSRNVPSVD